MQFNVWKGEKTSTTVIINDGLALFVLLCRGAGSKGQAVNSQRNSTRWWKSLQNVRIKSDIFEEFEGGKSCQIIALLNVNTAIWQVFGLVENRIV